MSGSEKPQDDLNDFAAALRALVPLPSAVSRDELMFRAGQASVERTLATHKARRWPWSLATAACALVAAMLGMMVGQSHSELMVQSQPATPDPITVDVAVSPSAPSTRSTAAYLAERNRILARGVDSLLSLSSDHDIPSSDPSYFELRDGLLRRDRS